MTSPELFHLLRPYVFRPLSAKNATYLRVYRYARHDGGVPWSGRKSLATSSKTRDIKKDDAGVEEDIHEARSHAVSARIQELDAADALVYPRIQPCASHMRIPAFREKFKDVSADSPTQDEVVLRGMHAESALV